MPEINYISVNGKVQAADEPALLVSNRGYRYGDGLFETIKLVEGKIQLENFHFERLFAGLGMLKFEIPPLFTAGKIREEILELCKKNRTLALARVRLSVYRGNGGLYEDEKRLEYVIESWPLEPGFNSINDNGLVTGIYTGAMKSCDQFSNLKSANALLYSMAALYAKEKQWNDCLVLNTNGRIADSTIANVFMIKEGVIRTPVLSEGCVAGVMRRYLIEKMQDSGVVIQEDAVEMNEMEEADEIFLTNAIRGIRWVRQFENRIYSNVKTLEIYKQLGSLPSV